MIWNETATRKLAGLVEAGFAAHAIARAIGNGCTSFAVRGKARRMEMKITRPKFGPPPKEPPPFPTSPVNWRAFECTPADNPKPLWELRAQECHWPLGEKPTLFCGRDTGGFLYCAKHHRIGTRRS